MEVRRWCALAVGSLVIAGLLSLSVVIGRIPVISRVIDDPLFFKRCLVVHVVLALVVWFYSFVAALLSLRVPAKEGTGALRELCFLSSAVGVFGMLAGAAARGAEPVLANYIPIIDHPLFLSGLTLFFAGIVTHFVHLLATARSGGRSLLPSAAATGVLASALMVVLAAVTWISSVAGLPGGVETWTRYEFSAWGAGHVLQVANIAAMLAVWLWALERITGRRVLSTGAVQSLFAVLIAPHFVLPLLTLRGTLNPLYHTGATQLMRWGIFPVVVVALVLCVRHLRRHGLAERSASHRALLSGLGASAGLTVLGFVLGACIRSSTTLVPAHYHASLGAITVAFMTAAYLLAEAVRGGDGLPARIWCAARWQLALFGVGQTIFALGFAIGGAYGLGRKAYAAEQHVRSAGEYAGLMVMGAGGLIAVVGGLWFLFLIVREIGGAWFRGESAAARAISP